MVDIVTLLHCLRPHVTATTVRQLSRIIVAGAFGHSDISRSRC